MKKTKTLIMILTILTGLCFCGCEKYPYIQDLGYNLAGSDTKELGHSIFYSTNVETRCKKLTVYVDSVNVGYINANYDANKHGSLSCDIKSVKNTVLKAMVKTGNHIITIESEGGCTFDKVPVVVKKESCFTMNIHSQEK